MSVGAVNKQTGDRIPTAGMPDIDSVLSGSSTNPVQNRVVKAALDEKADTGIVADDFDSTASYVIGNYCIKDGKLYRFKANHSGAWSSADVDEIQITGELATLKSGLMGKQNSLELGEADDLDEVKTNGCCIFNTSTLNTPVTGDGIVSTSYTEVSGYWFSLQIAIVFNSNTAYIRYSRNGWGAWKSFTLT